MLVFLSVSESVEVDKTLIFFNPESNRATFRLQNDVSFTSVPNLEGGKNDKTQNWSLGRLDLYSC